MGGAPAGQVVVDELRSVVRVDAGDVEREAQLQFGQAGGAEALAEFYLPAVAPTLTFSNGKFDVFSFTLTDDETAEGATDQ